MPIHAQLPAWLDLPQRPDGVDLGLLKSILASRGVNARGWRLYLDYGDAIFDALGRPWVDVDWPFRSGPNAIAFLRLLAACEMDVLPPVELVQSMVAWHVPSDQIDAIPPQFFRAAWKGCITATYDPAVYFPIWLGEHIVPVAQWYFDTRQHQEPNLPLLKAGWRPLSQRYASCAGFHARARETDEWAVPVRSVEYDGLRFVALASAADLKTEGAAMRHCIAGYDGICRESSLRAYSVRHRKSGTRLATLTVAHAPGTGGWRLDEIKGPENAAVDEYIVRATHALLVSLDEATAGDPAFREFLRTLQSRAVKLDELFGFEDDFRGCPL
ncbi:MAG: hypothetical protein Q8O25_02360 [Sulfurisoma sp.]|nr:hypothetical protein [Sulfurisoma sp.]